MELFGINISEIINSPGVIMNVGGASIILFQAWKIISSIFKPLDYVEKLYDIADGIVEQADNRIIDKIRIMSLKKDIQYQLKAVLMRRKKKIDLLIEKIKD